MTRYDPPERLTPEVHSARACLRAGLARWTQMSTEERAAAWQRVREAQHVCRDVKVYTLAEIGRLIERSAPLVTTPIPDGGDEIPF